MSSAVEPVPDLRPDGPAELTGRLDDFSLGELFELFTATGATGMLTFSEPVEATLWITGGRVSYGTSPGTPEPRELLDRQGVVAADRFDDAMAATAPGERLHETLRDRFDVDESRITAVAREQVVTTAFEIIAVGADSFEFRSGVVDPLGAALEMDHDEVLTEAEHRREEWRRIAESIPSTGVVVGLAPELPTDHVDVTLSVDEWRVVARIDGRRSVAEVIGVLGQSAFEVCSTLHDLVVDGTVQVIDAPRSGDRSDP